MRSKNSNLIKFVSLLIIFIIFTILIKTIDVAGIGPEGSKVGFSSLNESFHNFLGYNDTFYKISKYLGYASFLIIGFYGLLGLKDLIKKKSVLKVNKDILILGAFYVIVLFVYFLFEKVVINYRPVLEKGVLEASYPSSHTILSICVCASSIIISTRLFKNKDYTKIFNICTFILMLGIIITRTLSGVHWLTDIVGGIIISSSLCFLFKFLKKYKKNDK